MINDDEYREVQLQLRQLAQMLYHMNVIGMLARIEASAGAGPIFDPLLSEIHGGSLDEIKKLTNAALLFQIAVHRLAKEEGMR